MKHNVAQLFRFYLKAGREQLKKLKGNPFKKKWLKRLDRYIIVKFLGTYFFAIALIISIAVVFDINENIDDFINNKAPISAIIFDYYLNFIPYYTNLFSPLFVFIAVIFFTSKLAENSEIIAMFSTGMSFKRLMVPYMISAAIIALVTYVLSTEVIPTGSVTRLKFEQVYKNKKKTDYVRNIQLEVDTGVIAYMERYEDYNKTAYRFSLDKFEDHKLVSHLTARRITYDTTAVHRWIIKDYMIREMKGMRETITHGDRMDSIINMEPQDFLITRGQQETMTSPQLREYIDKQKQRGFANIKVFEVEYYRRIATSFAAFILTVIGLSLSSQKRKGGMGLHLGIGIALSFSYILFQTISSTFAINGNASPNLAVWIPNILYLFIAIYLYRKAPK
ncbi:MAG TPA: LptF/LptG family permease [Bacteroides mediterraneensis]|uniref:LptF/LptG family permease n=1 Tax=Bacteroides mediterraneensis TaxID=1841856 RepID=UPI00261ACBFE|nr:LptF/LptG family permease [Bacteroides mediterraneensis]HJH64532.1 LptF/LptG family permease [Bacteroides mediterraneensis]